MAGARGSLLLVALLAAVAGAPAAHAQTVAVGGVASSGGAGGLVRVLGVRDGVATFDAWARFGALTAGGASVRWAETFGPLGNVIVEASLDGAVGLGGGAPAGVRTAFGVRGVFGPVAASLRLEAGTMAEADLDPLAGARTREAIGAATGALDMGALASVTYRPDRATLVTLEPRVRWTRGAWSAWSSVSLRRAGLAPELDGWMGLEGGAVAGTGAAALGTGLVWVRRREPESSLRLWIGADGDGVRPGAEAAFAGRVPGGSTTLTLGYVPHRLEDAPWRVALDTVVPGGPPLGGTWRVALAAAGDGDGVRWGVVVSLERPLSPLAGRP